MPRTIQEASGSQPCFDAFAENYTDDLEAGLSVSGEGQKFFAAARIKWVAKRTRELGFITRRTLDFGCGQGSSTPLLLSALKASTALGVDVSPGLLSVATQKNSDPRVSYALASAAPPTESFDCAYTNGVLHHIPLPERGDAMRYVFHSLRPGGLFALWENNPWNPGTRYVMRRIPFDRNAITLTIPECTRLASDSGFEILRVDSLFFFPRFLRFFRPLEPMLSFTRLGAQYMVLCRKT